MRTLPAFRRRLTTATILLALACGGDGPAAPDPNAVASVSITPTAVTVNVGSTLQLTAVAKNSTGSPVTTSITWTSGSPTVAMVSASGLVSGVAAGNAVVTASGGGHSGTASVTVNDTRPPAVPSGFTATVFSHGEVDLAWTDNADNEVSFVIERELATSTNAFTLVATVGANVTTFRDAGLTPATAYRYRVKARNANGDSQYTTSVEVTTQGMLTITTTALSDGTLNQVYGLTLGATGGSGSYQWSLKTGTLPAGLALSPEGVISGTPTAVDTAAVTVAVASGAQSAEKDFTLTVNEQILAPEVVTTALPSGIEGVPYSSKLEGRGGDGTYTWTLTGGTLPAGLTLASEGTVSGTPTTAGTATFTVQLQSAGLTGTGPISLGIYPVLAVTTTTLPLGRIGKAYTATLAASGGNATYTWEALSGVPAGLTLATTGVLSGTPTAAGNSTISVKVTSGDGQSKTSDVALSVLDTLRVTTTSVSVATVGQGYTATLTAAGGSGTNGWAISAGALPPGLSLAPSTGVISGTPTTAGNASFTVRVSSSDGQQASAALQLLVLPGPVTITTEGLPVAQVNTAYSATLVAVGGDGSGFAWSVSNGTLPAGLSLNASNGVIDGTPTTAATVTFTVQANSGGYSGIRALTLTVSPAPAPGYNITLVYQTSLSATHQAAFENAKARWEGIITDDLPEEFGGIPDCGDFHPATPGTVDDLVIYVTVDSIDGQGKVLGRAGPCYVRDDSYLPVTGAMTFDEADLDWLAERGLLVNTILHEMGHVLGFGILWNHFYLITGECVADPAFTGAGALTAFSSVGGDSYSGAKVPIENTGTEGDGSNCAHWRETVFGTELLTPYINSGKANPLSIVTVQSLGDMGYTVTDAGADPYSLPPPSPAGVAAERDPEGVFMPDDLLPAPILVIRPGGRVEVLRPPPAPVRR